MKSFQLSFRIPLLIFFLGLAGLILWPQFLKLPLYDENIFIVEGMRTAAGELPYRDFFDFIGPGTFYLVAGMIRIFGVSLLALRGSVLLSLLICVGCVRFVGRNFLPRRWLIALMLFVWVSLIPRGFQVQHHLFSMAMGLVSVTMLFQWLEHQKDETNDFKPERWLAFSGFFAGLSLLFTQSTGLALILSESTFLLFFQVDRLKSVGLENTGRAIIKTVLTLILFSALPVLCAALFFESQHALQDFRTATVDWLLTGRYQGASSSWYLGEGFIKLPLFWPDRWDRIVLFCLQAGLPILGILWGSFLAVEFLKRRRADQNRILSFRQWQALLLLTTGTAFFITAFSYPNTVVVAYHGWLLYLLSGIALFSLLKKRPRLERWILSGFFALVAVLVFHQLQQSWTMIREPRLLSYGTVEQTLMSPAGWSRERVKKLNALVYDIHEKTAPDESIFTYNVSPHVYLLTGRKNPTRYQLLISGYNTPAQFEEAARTLREDLPRFVVYDGIDALWFRHDLRFEAFRGSDYRIHPIEAVLQRYYRFRGYIDELAVYERRSGLK